MNAAADALPWNRRAPGRGRGIACYFSFGSYAAAAADVSVDRNAGTVRVHRVASAIDCGRPVNPAGIEAQAEGP